MSNAPATLEQLSAWSGDVASRALFSVLSNQNLLMLDADADALDLAEQQRIAGWLQTLACPTIGIAPAGSANPVAQACDVLVEQLGDTSVLTTTIDKNPIAAAVLVQLLRTTEHLPLEAALTAESLAYATLQGGPEFRQWLLENRAPAPATATDSGPAVIMEAEGERLALALNRASNHNAMSVEMRDALIEALQLALSDDSILAVTISGRGRCFCTGGDLTEFGTAPDPAAAHLIRSLALPGRLLAQCADRVTVQLHGACIGSGIEFPAFAKRLIADAGTHFQLPELSLGLIPGAGGCVSIPRRIGRQRTAWLALSGKRINARQALSWGLVDAVS